MAVPERNLRRLLRCQRIDRRRPQRNHGGESRKGRPKARHCVRRVRHRVAARPVLPVLFRFVPGLGPELVLLRPAFAPCPPARHLSRLRGRASRFDGRSHPSPGSGSGDAAGVGPSSRPRPRALRAPRTDIRSPLLKRRYPLGHLGGCRNTRCRGRSSNGVPAGHLFLSAHSSRLLYLLRWLEE